jgi:hypothetical protein
MLLIRADSAPHLRQLLEERIESVSRELANALPRPAESGTALAIDAETKRANARSSR